MVFFVYFFPQTPGRVASSPATLWTRLCGSHWSTMAERTSSGLLTMMLEPTPAVGMTLPAEVREKLAELELELSEGKLTTKR